MWTFRKFRLSKWQDVRQEEAQVLAGASRVDLKLLLPRRRLLRPRMQVLLPQLLLRAVVFSEVCLHFVAISITSVDLGGNIISGMASGAGFSMANRAVDAVLGPRQVEMVHTQAEPQVAQQAPAQMNQPINTSNLCQLQQEQLNQCLSQVGDMSHCNYYFESLKQCQTSSRT